MKNWFGLEPHPTDEYIHWTQKNPKEVATKLRVAYDAIVYVGLRNELEQLLASAYATGRDSELDYNDPV